MYAKYDQVEVDLKYVYVYDVCMHVCMRVPICVRV